VFFILSKHHIFKQTNSFLSEHAIGSDELDGLLRSVSRTEYPVSKTKQSIRADDRIEDVISASPAYF